MSALFFYVRFLSIQVLSCNIRMIDCLNVGASKHILTMKNTERIVIGVPKHILNARNIYHDVMTMQNIHHDQLRKFKQFHVHQQEDTTSAKIW